MNPPLKTTIIISPVRSGTKSITLIELLVSIITVTAMVLTIFGIYTYSNSQVINTERRTKVANEMAYALEHMTKYVQQANGSLSRKAIQYAGATGFRVYVDFRNPQTPSDYTDDGWIDYTLSSNTLTATCTANGGTCPFTTETLTTRIIPGVAEDTIMPDTDNPASGYYIYIDSLGNIVEVGLVGRYNPALTYDVTTRLSNPQVKMKSKIICNNASTN